MNCLQYIVETINTVIAAAADENGLPVTAAVCPRKAVIRL